MKLDLWTKTTLTLIAIFLAIIALKPLVPKLANAAGGTFEHVQLFMHGPYLSFFDRQTGDIWRLDPGSYEWYYDGTVVKLGKQFQPPKKP